MFRVLLTLSLYLLILCLSLLTLYPHLSWLFISLSLVLPLSLQPSLLCLQEVLWGQRVRGRPRDQSVQTPSYSCTKQWVAHGGINRCRSGQETEVFILHHAPPWVSSIIYLNVKLFLSYTNSLSLSLSLSGICYLQIFSFYHWICSVFTDPRSKVFKQ